MVMNKMTLEQFLLLFYFKVIRERILSCTYLIGYSSG